MKNTKRIFAFLLAVMLMATVFCSCAGESKDIIGIIQFGSHDSLNNCYNGIVEALGEKVNLDDYEIQYVNSNFTAETSLAQAQKMVNSNAKVIIAIATPSAIQAATAATGKDVPVVYCAVTDASQVANFKNMTGTSDIPDFKAQLELVTAFMGKSDLKIGVLSSTEESSDALQISMLETAAKAYKGMSIVTEVVADITTIDTKVDSLISKDIDCIVNLLDNTIVGKLQNILADKQIDEARILTEAAIFADKVAVDEETTRLYSHISQYRKILSSKEPRGRKLDFLTQELNRETNTIGSKSNDLAITNMVVEIKSEIEKIREQIQNIE